MRADVVTVRSSDGGAFACHLAVPAGDAPAPAVVLASTVRGVDDDLLAIAREFAGHGFIAAAPDLFWRGKDGSQPRVEQIRIGERDMVDTLAQLRTISTFNGRAAAMGFCYGGPYAILGPKRLGYCAGIACHGTQMLDFVEGLRDVSKPVCIVWGDRDHLAPVDVLDAYRAVPAHAANVEVHILPGVLHGYMMPGNAKAFDRAARDFSMDRALATLDRLRPGA